jgi:hypothetical protein
MIHSLPCQLHPPSPEQERLASQTRTNRAACRDSECSPMSLKIAVSARKLGVHGTQNSTETSILLFLNLFFEKKTSHKFISSVQSANFILPPAPV